MAKGVDIDIASEAGSRETAHGICDALRQRGFVAQCITVQDDLGGLISSLQSFSPDAVFNLAETPMGDSTLESFVPSVLECLGIAYTGADAGAIHLCLNKVAAKDVLAGHGIAAPRHRVWDGKAPQDKKWHYPSIVKPLREDGSIGINENSVVYDEAGLIRQVDFIQSRYQQAALIEEYIEGREFNVSILGNDPPVVLPVCEIDFSLMPAGLPRIVSFKAKWVSDSAEYKGSVPVCPVNLDEEMRGHLERMALAAFRVCGLRDYARVDMRWDGKHLPMIVDVNPNPAISPDTGFVLSAQAAGLTYPELLEKITRYALSRREGVR